MTDIRQGDFAKLIGTPAIKSDLQVLRMRAQLPSMSCLHWRIPMFTCCRSVPNWIALITGAPPEWHGVLGNLLVPETSFDSVFR